MSKERPTGVYIIALLQVLNAITIGASVFLADAYVLDDTFQFNDVMSFVFAFLNVLSALGLLMMWRWAWVGTMLWTGVNLAGGLVNYWNGEPNYPSMFLHVLMVFYLNLREVQDVFHAQAPHEPQTATPLQSITQDHAIYE